MTAWESHKRAEVPFRSRQTRHLTFSEVPGATGDIMCDHAQMNMSLTHTCFTSSTAGGSKTLLTSFVPGIWTRGLIHACMTIADINAEFRWESFACFWFICTVPLLNVSFALTMQWHPLREAGLAVAMKPYRWRQFVHKTITGLHINTAVTSSFSLGGHCSPRSLMPRAFTQLWCSLTGELNHSCPVLK